jgi:hypothetical protein
MTDFSDVRIFFCTTPTNRNYGFDRLMSRAQEIFQQDPCSGPWFLFLNRSRDRIKILFWDRDGFCIFYKRCARHGDLAMSAAVVLRRSESIIARSIAPVAAPTATAG